MTDPSGTGVVLELDQSLRQRDKVESSVTVRSVLSLVAAGFEDQIALGTDGARRSLWTALGGEPGLSWLASDFRAVLAHTGVKQAVLDKVFRGNALRALGWRQMR